jgi:hypothetical protein
MVSEPWTPKGAEKFAYYEGIILLLQVLNRRKKRFYASFGLEKDHNRRKAVRGVKIRLF